MVDQFAMIRIAEREFLTQGRLGDYSPSTKRETFYPSVDTNVGTRTRTLSEIDI